MKNSLVAFLLALMAAVPVAFCEIGAQAQQIDYSVKTVSELIDELTKIDSPAPGVSSTANYGGFIVDNSPGEFEVGVLGVPAPKVPPQMSELVRRGPLALPELIEHLNDTRPTKLDVFGTYPDPGGGIGFFMLSYFGSDYDPRVQHPIGKRELKRVWKKQNERMVANRFSGKYRVKVGDVCFALIGQIVNRRLLAVRYQPSAILVVNSPIEAPELVQNVRDDWKQGDPELLKASLLSDIHKGKVSEPDFAALKRLRFYFPHDYDALKGNDLRKRRQFEREERGDERE